MEWELDELDARLLNRLQQGVPLAERPFVQTGRELELAEEQVLQRIRRLKTPPGPIIRQISAIFDSKTLGYVSTLVAAKVDPQRIDEAAAVISRHPGVSHNYRRNHDYNLWYTLAVPPDSRLGLERTVEVLHRQSEAAVTRVMPTLRLFKIGVKLDLSGQRDATARAAAPPALNGRRAKAGRFALTDGHRRMIRVLQQDLPIKPEPFAGWADQAGVSVAELLDTAGAFEAAGAMRRFSAVLHHRRAGFSANAMGIWVVPEARQEQFGATAASFQAVSHCYLRPTYEDWPYNLFTMVHAPSQEECETVLAAISKATGIDHYSALYSTHEYKKVRVKYFAGDIEQWEEQIGAALVP